MLVATFMQRIMLGGRGEVFDSLNMEGEGTVVSGPRAWRRMADNTISSCTRVFRLGGCC